MKITILDQAGREKIIIENVVSIISFQLKVEFKDIKGNKYEFNHNEISGWYCYDVI